MLQVIAQSLHACDRVCSLGLALEGRHHSGIDDSRNIARILQRMIADGYVPAPTAAV